MKVHVLAKKRFGTVHAELFHPSPLQISVSYPGPAPSANRHSFSLEENVNFNVIILAISIPWVLAVLHPLGPPLTVRFKHFDIFAFKTLCETTLPYSGEIS
jgi:hypothetical protein